MRYTFSFPSFRALVRAVFAPAVFIFGAADTLFESLLFGGLLFIVAIPICLYYFFVDDPKLALFCLSVVVFVVIFACAAGNCISLPLWCILFVSTAAIAVITFPPQFKKQTQ